MRTDNRSLGSLPEVRAVFQSALQEMVRITRAERAAVLFSDGPLESPTARAVYELPLEGFWEAAPLSTELLRQVRKSGESVGITDISKDARWTGHLSLLLCDVRSLACVPIWGSLDRSLGLLYVDWRSGPISRVSACLEALELIARKLESFLTAVAQGQAQVSNPFNAPELQPLRRPIPAPPRPVVYATRSNRVFKAPTLAAQTIFFRSFAVLFGAAIPIQRSLQILGKQSEDEACREIALELGRRVERGQSLSEAVMALKVFGATLEQLIAVGERTGSLHRILAQLAEGEERRLNQQRRMQAVLVYPAVVGAFCLLFLMLVPGLLLSRQAVFLKELGVELPLLTRTLMAAAQILGSPLLWLVSLAGGGAVLAAAGRRRQLLNLLKKATRRLPGARAIYESMIFSQFCQTLAVQLRAGLSLHEALERASRSGGPDSPLIEQIPQLAERLKNGMDLTGNLAATGMFPPLVLAMVGVGEESGRLDFVLSHLVRYYDEDFQHRIEVFISLIEPMVVCVLGIGAGACLLITMLPMVKAIQQL